MRWRAWFRIHLITAVALSLLVGALLGLNLRHCNSASDCLSWIIADRPLAAYVEGWPLFCFRGGSPGVTVLPDILLIDVFCWILLTLICAWVCERYARRVG